MKRFLPLVVLMGLLLSGVAKAAPEVSTNQPAPEVWTNQAGRAVVAELAGFKAGTVELILTNGSSLKLPLGGLSAECQERVRQAFDGGVVPDSVQEAFVTARGILERARVLRSSGKMTDEELNSIRSAALVAFEAAVTTASSQKLPASSRAKIEALRTSL